MQIEDLYYVLTNNDNKNKINSSMVAFAKSKGIKVQDGDDIAVLLPKIKEKLAKDKITVNDFVKMLNEEGLYYDALQIDVVLKRAYINNKTSASYTGNVNKVDPIEIRQELMNKANKEASENGAKLMQDVNKKYTEEKEKQKREKQRKKQYERDEQELNKSEWELFLESLNESFDKMNASVINGGVAIAKGAANAVEDVLDTGAYVRRLCSIFYGVWV